MVPEDNKNFNFEEEMQKSFARRPANNNNFSGSVDIPKEIRDLLNSEKFKDVSASIKKQMSDMLDTFVVTAEAVARVCGNEEGMLAKGKGLAQKLNMVLEDIVNGKIKLSDAYGQEIKLDSTKARELNAKSVEVASRILISQMVLGMNSG